MRQHPPPLTANMEQSAMHIYNTKLHLSAYLKNYDSGFNHRNAIRWLKNRDPILWRNILETTNFLPENAKPKQRCWHILNEIYERPTCPQTREFVKWWENRYLKFISQSAKAKYMNLNGLTNNQTKAAREKRISSNQKTIDAGLRKLPNISNEIKAIRKEKRERTLLIKHGVTNPNDIPGVREKISNKWVERGATPKHLRTKRRIYYDTVWYYTEKNWKEHFDDINPKRINRSENALDHIYSIQQGFRDNIPPYIIGHYTNLRIITLSDNSKKGMRCDKSREQLFEDFFLNQQFSRLEMKVDLNHLHN